MCLMGEVAKRSVMPKLHFTVCHGELFMLHIAVLIELSGR